MSPASLSPCDDRSATVLIKRGLRRRDQQGFRKLEAGSGLCAGRPATFGHLGTAPSGAGSRLVDTGDLDRELVELARDR